MLLHVDLEALAIAAILPVCDFIPETIKKRAAAEVQPADKHAPQMAKVTDSVASRAQGEEEFDGCHGGNKRPHGNHDGEWEDPNTPVGKQDGVRDEDAINCTRSADGWNVTRQMSPNHWEHLDQNRNHPSTDSAEEKVIQEPVFAPDLFELTAKHPEKQHVDEQMEKATMKEDVCYGLPDAKSGKRSEGDETEMVINPKGGIAPN